MAIAKLPDGLPSTAAYGREILGLSRPSRPAPLERQQTSWRCPDGIHRRASLYRMPALPVYACVSPGGPAVSVQRYRDDTRDWRKISQKAVAEHFASLEAAMTENVLQKIPAGIRTKSEHGKHSDALRQLEGLLSAVGIGNLQACHEKAYWAPGFLDPQGSVSVTNVRSPISRLITATPDISSLDPKGDGVPQLKICADVCPLAACHELALARGRRRVALVRFSAIEDRRSLLPCLTDYRDTQLFVQTTYLQALQDMPKHIHADPIQSLDAGDIIYTTDVSMLRGPLCDGAPWLKDVPVFDVLWAALQRTPRCDDQGQYARIGEKAAMAKTIDRIFACAAAAEVDVLVFPPPGVGGAASCRHPAEDAGDLLRKAILEHAKFVPKVYVCQEYPGQLHNVWSPFATALENFREPIEHRELVPLVASPYIRPGWQPRKQKESNFVHLRSGLRRPLSARSGPSSLGNVGNAIVC